MEKDKILICDDEEGTRESLKLIISEKYTPVISKTGDEAMNLLKTDPGIKAVLLDIKMPKRNGVDILKDIKSQYSNMAVIIVTGYQSVEACAETIKAGASNYIVKPFDSKVVLETVEKLL